VVRATATPRLRLRQVAPSVGPGPLRRAILPLEHLTGRSARPDASMDTALDTDRRSRGSSIVSSRDGSRMLGDPG